MGVSPPICPDGAQAILTTYNDPKLGNNDIGFGKGINGSFKCPSPDDSTSPGDYEGADSDTSSNTNPCPLTTQTINNGKTCNYSLNS